MRPVPLRRKLCCQGSLLAFPGHSRLSQDAQTSLCPQPCTFGSKACSASAAAVCVALLPRCKCQGKDPESQEALVKCRHRVIGLCWAPRSASPTSRASLPGKGVSSDSDSLRSFLLLRECSCCRARTSDENCEAAPPLRPRHQSSASDSASPASTKHSNRSAFSAVHGLARYQANAVLVKSRRVEAERPIQGALTRTHGASLAVPHDERRASRSHHHDLIVELLGLHRGCRAPNRRHHCPDPPYSWACRSAACRSASLMFRSSCFGQGGQGFSTARNLSPPFGCRHLHRHLHAWKLAHCELTRSQAPRRGLLLLLLALAEVFMQSPLRFVRHREHESRNFQGSHTISSLASFSRSWASFQRCIVGYIRGRHTATAYLTSSSRRSSADLSLCSSVHETQSM